MLTFFWFLFLETKCLSCSYNHWDFFFFLSLRNPIYSYTNPIFLKWRYSRWLYVDSVSPGKANLEALGPPQGNRTTPLGGKWEE